MDECESCAHPNDHHDTVEDEHGFEVRCRDCDGCHVIGTYTYENGEIIGDKVVKL